MLTADVVTAPVQIDQTAAESGLNGTGVCQGEYQAPNGDMFQVLTSQVAPFKINVSRSQDGGKNWVLQDTANAPATFIGVVFQSFFRPADSTNGVITIGYSVATANTVKWITFDCALSQFGIPGTIADLTDVLRQGQPSFPFTVRDDGTILACYTQAGATPRPLGFRIATAGVWSAFAIISQTVGHGLFPQGIVLLPAGFSLLIFQDSTNVPLNIGNYFSVIIGTVAGAINGPIDVTQNSDVFNQPALIGGKIYVPLARGPGGTTSKATVFISPDGVAWTVTDLDTRAFSDAILSVSVNDQGGTPVFLWDFESLDGTVNVVLKSVNFAPATTFYDVNALPPNAVAPSSQFVSQVNGATRADGTLVATMTMLTVLGDFSAFFAIGGGVSPIVPIVSPFQLVIFPFPIAVDCCCPEDAACISPSKDGNLYAFTKGPQVIKNG